MNDDQTTEESYGCFIQGQFFAIPPYMLEGLWNYVKHGIPPGFFLCAVLENDLVKATGMADAQNIACLPAYASFLVSKAPGACWGSPEKVDRWVAMKREARTHAK